MRTPFPYRCQIALTVAILLTVALAGLSMADLQPAFVKEKLSKTEKVWPGQRLTLYITLYTNTSFSGSTHFELPKVSGMLIMENEDRPLIGTEMVDGLSYIFKCHEIVLFPLRFGSLSMPAITVEFGFREESGKVVKKSFATRQFQFDVLEIPGANPRRPILTTANFKIKEQWNSEPDKAKVGDALTRTIIMTADDLPGMAFSPLELKKVDGLGLYTRQPRVEDQRQRGEFTGRRTETITYICEQKGSFEIPGLSIQWWNPQTEILKDVSLQAVKFKVAANPLLQKVSPVNTPQTKSIGFPWIWATIILLFSALIFVVFFLFRSKRPQHETKTIDHEKKLFMKFQKVAASHDAAATMRALLGWLDYSKITGNCRTLKRFYTLAENPELKKQIESLETSLYAKKPERQWSGDELSTAVQQARKNLKTQQLHSEPPRLPELNP